MVQNANLLTYTASGTGTSDPLHVNKSVSVSLDFYTGPGAGTIELQRSFDDGLTWKIVETWADTSYEGIVEEVASYVLYQFKCTAYTSGDIYCVLGA